MTERDLKYLSTFHTKCHNENILATNNFKQATVQNYRTRCYYEQHLTTRRWRWIGHVLRQKDDNISKTALKWTPVGKRKRGRPKKRRRTVEKELEQLYLNWGQAAKQATDRTKWSTLVSAQCASGHKEDYVIK